MAKLWQRIFGYDEVSVTDQELTDYPGAASMMHTEMLMNIHKPFFTTRPAKTAKVHYTPPKFDEEYSPVNEYSHIRDSTSAIWSEFEQWTEYIHPNGSLYWTCSAYPGHVISDVKPPLSGLDTNAPTTISRIMHALKEIPQLQDYHNWEIYTDGMSCIYIDHGSRAASDAFQSLNDFRSQIAKLNSQMSIKSRLRLESAYWTYVQSHPNHRVLPDNAIDDATEAVVWCHADRALFKSSNAPFSQDDAREMTELMKTVAELKRPTLKTWYCAAILRAICRDRLASHYGQNDAQEVRRREKAEDIESSPSFNSVKDKIIWYFIAAAALGAPLRYIKRISNVDRTSLGDGVNTLRWRAFLKSLCKEWTDSNLLATVLVSATVALLAIPELNGMAQIAGIISALYALSSVLCGMLLISNHQDRVETFGITAVSYFQQAKSRSTGTIRPLAVILSLPLSFMLWGMFWFIFAVVSFAYSSRPQELSHQYLTATRILSLLFLSALVVIGFFVLRFFHGIWRDRTNGEIQAPAQSTADDMVIGQGGNPLMQFSGDQRLASTIPANVIPEARGPSSAVPVYAGRVSGRSMTDMHVTYPPIDSSRIQPTGPAATTNHPLSYGPSPALAPIASSSNVVMSPTSAPPNYSAREIPLARLILTVINRESWLTSIRDQKAYEVIVANVRRECEKYGPISDFLIPRSQDPSEDELISGVGRIYVSYMSREAASTAFMKFQSEGLLGYEVS